MPKTLEAASAGSTDPPSSPDAMASPQHSTLSDGSTSSGYPTPHLSSASSASGYSWLLDRPPRLSPHRPHPSGSGPPLAPEIPSSPPLPLLLQGLPSPSSSGSSEIPPSPQHTWSDQGPTGTFYPSDRFAPSHHPSSLSSDSLSPYRFSDEPMSTPHSPASLPVAGGSLSTPYSAASGGSPSETPPDDAEFFNKNMMKKLKIVAGAVIVGGAIAGIAGSQIKHRDCQDS
jgi:hypothetical protein